MTNDDVNSAPQSLPQGIHIFLLFLMIFTLCHEASAEYGTNRTILQKIRYIDGKQEHVIKATYIITEIKETKSIGEGIFSKKADGKFIIVRFKFYNKGGIAVPTSTLTDLMLIDGKKKHWDYSLGATGSMRLGTESFGRMEIAPDKWMDDVVVFEVPEDVRDYLILLPGGAKVSAGAQMDKKKTAKAEEELKRESKENKNSKEDIVPAAKKQKDAKIEEPKSEGKKSLQELLNAAGIFYKEGKCEDFIDANEKAIEIASKQNNMAVEGKLHYNVAECYTRLNKYEDAKRHLDSAIAIGAKIKDAELETLALMDKSRVLIAKGDKENVSDIFKTAFNQANKEIFPNIAVKDDVKALVSLQMAQILMNTGDREAARERLEYALKVNHDFRMEEIIANTLKSSEFAIYKEISGINAMLDEAWSLYERGDYKGMEGVSRNAIDASKKLGYKRGGFGGSYYLAMSLLNRDEHDNAIDYALLAQELSEKGNDEVRLGMVYNLIGNIFKQKKAYEKALHYYNRYLDIVKRTGNREGEAVALNNMGNVSMDKGEYRDALKYYEDSLKIGLEIGADKHMIAQEYLGIGRVSKKLADYKNAEKSLSIVINIFRELGNEGGEVVGLWEMAGNYTLQNKYLSAIKLLEDNLGRAEKLGMKQSFIDDLIDNSEKNKDYLRVEKYKNMKAD